MKIVVLLAVLLVGFLASPASHSAHCHPDLLGRAAPCPHPRLLRIVRSPQPPKVVRPLGR